MPQDVALMGEFTVKDAIYFFGRVLEVEDDVIKERYKTFSELLALPPDNRYIRDCSGGEQRRVSFAASLIHDPELLILDEPTAGVDSVLRDSIWNYLVELATEKNTAIIITTHYIEEARKANKVAMLRKGRFLTEDSPESLIEKYNAQTLEEVFLDLSKHQEEEEESNRPYDRRRSPIPLQPLDSNLSQHPRSSSEEVAKKKETRKRFKRSYLKGCRVRALLDKNLKQFYRNLLGASFHVIFPICQTLIFLTAVGRDVKDIPLAIVNDGSMIDTCSNYVATNTAIPVNEVDCIFQNINCRFLSYLDVPMLQMKYYSSVEEALSGVKSGKAVGVLYMAENFTDGYQQLFHDGYFAEPEAVELGQIKVWLDMSNRPIGMSVKGKIFKRYQDFQKDVYEECKLSRKLAEAPLYFEKAIFGDLEDEFVIFTCPAIIQALSFFLGTLLTSHIIITERHEGIWERSIVAGITALEITITHVIFQASIVLFQLIEMIIVAFCVLKFPCLGSVYLLGGVCYLQALFGIVFGFWVSVVSINHSMGQIFSISVTFLSSTACGMLWPIEGTPLVMQWINWYVPFTTAIIVCRNIMLKGWTIAHPMVWFSSGLTLAWILGFIVLSVFVIRKK